MGSIPKDGFESLDNFTGKKASVEAAMERRLR